MKVSHAATKLPAAYTPPGVAPAPRGTGILLTAASDEMRSSRRVEGKLLAERAGVLRQRGLWLTSEASKEDLSDHERGCLDEARANLETFRIVTDELLAQLFTHEDRDRQIQACAGLARVCSQIEAVVEIADRIRNGTFGVWSAKRS